MLLSWPLAEKVKNAGPRIQRDSESLCPNPNKMRLLTSWSENNFYYAHHFMPCTVAHTWLFSYCAKIFLCCSSCSCRCCLCGISSAGVSGQSRFHSQKSISFCDIWDLTQAMIVSRPPSLVSQISPLTLIYLVRLTSSGKVNSSGGGRGPHLQWFQI